MTPTKPVGHEDVPELLSCPFCGGVSDATHAGGSPRLEQDSHTNIYVWCPSCGAKGLVVVGGHGGTFQEAITAWNRRAKAPAQATDVAEAIVQMIERRWRTWEGLPAPTSAMNRSYSTAAKIILQDATALYAPAEATELAPDVKGLVEQLHKEAYDQGQPLARLLHEAADPISRLSAPPAEAPSAYLNSAGIPELPISYPVDWRAHPAEHGLTPLYKHPSPPAEAKPVAWSVKPLEWRGDVAQSLVGLYLIEHSFSGFFWSLNGYRGALREGFDRREAAEAAAQADHQTKINSAIIVHPDLRAKAAEAVPEGMVLIDGPELIELRDTLRRIAEGPMADYRQYAREHLQRAAALAAAPPRNPSARER